MILLYLDSAEKRSLHDRICFLNTPHCVDFGHLLQNYLVDGY